MAIARRIEPDAHESTGGGVLEDLLRGRPPRRGHVGLPVTSTHQTDHEERDEPPDEEEADQRTDNGSDHDDYDRGAILTAVP